jgi:hypothetical protein
MISIPALIRVIGQICLTPVIRSDKEREGVWDEHPGKPLVTYRDSR